GRRRRERLGHARAEVAGVGDQRLARDRAGRVAAEKHERIRLLERRRRLDADLFAVVRPEAEPYLLVGLRERRIGRARAGRVDADALLEEAHGLARDVRADGLLAVVVVGLAVLLSPTRGLVEVGDVEVLVELLEVRLPAEPG